MVKIAVTRKGLEVSMDKSDDLIKLTGEQQASSEDSVLNSMPLFANSPLMDLFNEVINTLTEREQQVLRLRFGLDDGKQRTLKEVGDQFNLSPESIRVIEAKALRRLRHPKYREYVDEILKGHLK